MSLVDKILRNSSWLLVVLAGIEVIIMAMMSKFMKALKYFAGARSHLIYPLSIQYKNGDVNWPNQTTAQIMNPFIALSLSTRARIR